MSEVESWRVKKYYKPRVLIGVEDVLSPPLPPMTLVCLTGSELLLLRNVLAYCHRRSTFVVTYGTETYVTPDAETWDVLQAIVADLEGKLMTGCEDLLEKFDEIIAAMLDQNTLLEGIPAALSTIDETLGLLDADLAAIDGTLGSHSSSLACICNALQQIQQDPATSAQVEEYLGDGTLQIPDPYPGDPTPGEDADACAVAQLMWSFAYETLGEIIQPAQVKAVSVLLPLAMAVIASWIGTPVLGIPVGVILALLWDIIEVWVEGSLEGVMNAIFSNKQEMVCAAYTVLAEDASLGAASAAVADLISEMPDLSPIDKIVLRGLTAPWVLSRMAVAWENQTSWATARVDAGYCAGCPEEPIVGSDWVAVPYYGPNRVITMDHPAGTYWQNWCWNYTVPAGYTLAGMFYEVTEHSGNCQEKRMDLAGICGATSITPNTSDNFANNWYFQYQPFQFNDAECKATIKPTAVSQNNMTMKTGVACSMGLQSGWSCTGYSVVTIKYLVFKGTVAPP